PIARGCPMAIARGRSAEPPLLGQHHTEERDVVVNRTHRSVPQLCRHQKEVARLEPTSAALDLPRQGNDDRKSAALGDLASIAQFQFIDLEHFMSDQRFALWLQ